MRLSAKIVKNVNNVNSWQHANQAYMAEGQENTLYIQLVNLDISTAVEGEKSPAFPQYPMRYLSQASALGVSVTFPALVDDEEITISGIQPFADDKSIWKFTIPSNKTPNTGYIKITVIEDGVSKSFMVRNAIVVEMLEIGGC